MLFFVLFATLISTDNFGYIWGGAGMPSWMPTSVSSEDTPGSQNYGPSSHRLTPRAAAAFYATLDGHELRCEAIGSNAVPTRTYAITSRRLLNYAEFVYAVTNVHAGFGKPWLGSWSSSAFDYNYRGYPTYARLAGGAYKDFGWTKFPLTQQIAFTALAGFGDLQGLNERGLLPYWTAVFYPHKSGDQAPILDIFDHLNYGEEYDDPRNTPDMCQNARTNGEDYVKYDLSMDEMLAVQFGTDPRGIRSGTHRINDIFTNRMSVLNQAMSLFDRAYYQYPQMWTSHGYETWKYRGVIKSAEAEEVEVIVEDGEPRLTTTSFTPSIPMGGTTNEVTITRNDTADFDSPRFRVSAVTKRFGMSTHMDSAVIELDFERWAHDTLEEWYPSGDGYVDITLAITEAEEGEGYFGIKMSDDSGPFAWTDVTLGAPVIEDGTYTIELTGHLTGNYTVQQTLRGTNTIEAKTFPCGYIRNFLNGSCKARIFESMLDTELECPAITSSCLVTPWDDDIMVRYRSTTRHYTTASTLVGALRDADDNLLAAAKSRAEARTGSGKFYDYGDYADLDYDDWQYAQSMITNLDLKPIWITGNYSTKSNYVYRYQGGMWRDVVSKPQAKIDATPVYRTGSAQWEERPQTAVDTRRAVVGEANFDFPVKKSRDGTINTVHGVDTMQFCSPIVSAGEHKDAYAATLAEVVDGDEPVYYVCESGFEGAWSNSIYLTGMRFSYLTNVESRAFAYANCEDDGLEWVKFPGLRRAYTNAFEGAFDGCTALTNADFHSLQIAYGAAATGPTNVMARFESDAPLTLNVSNISAGILFDLTDCTDLEEIWFNNVTGVVSYGSGIWKPQNDDWRAIVPDELYSRWVRSAGWSDVRRNIRPASGANFLTFTAQAAGSTVAFDWSVGSNVAYRVDGGVWQTYTSGTVITLTNVGDRVQFKGRDIQTQAGHHFTMSGRVAASGSATSLVDEEGLDDTAESRFYNMFDGCTALTEAPELPGTNQVYYSEMFAGCTELTDAPELPATKLSQFAYYAMFYGCTALTNAPALPATTLSRECYGAMFYGCTALKTAPELPATTMAEDCYYNMFYGCTALTEVRTHQTSFTGCGGWLPNNAGTFHCTAALKTYIDSHERKSSTVPSAWTVEADVTTP